MNPGGAGRTDDALLEFRTTTGYFPACGNRLLRAGMAVRILILDDNSQVGAALLELFDGVSGVECRVLTARLLETSLEGVAQRIQIFAPHYVINSYTVDQAHTDEGIGRSHMRLVKLVCQESRTCGAVMIYLSSALVFDGTRGQPFSESDKPRPRRALGRRLLELERIVERYCGRFVILRTGWIFGPNPNSHFMRFLERIERGERITLRRGVLGAPASSSDVARVIWAMIQQLDCGADCWGIYHYASGDSASSREFAETVITLASQYGEIDADHMRLVESINSSSWSIAVQPMLKCNRILNDFGIKQRPWRSAMTTILKAIYRKSGATAGES